MHVPKHLPSCSTSPTVRTPNAQWQQHPPPCSTIPTGSGHCYNTTPTPSTSPNRLQVTGRKAITLLHIHNSAPAIFSPFSRSPPPYLPPDNAPPSGNEQDPPMTRNYLTRKGLPNKDGYSNLAHDAHLPEPLDKEGHVRQICTCISLLDPD